MLSFLLLSPVTLIEIPLSCSLYYYEVSLHPVLFLTFYSFNYLLYRYFNLTSMKFLVSAYKTRSQCKISSFDVSNTIIYECLGDRMCGQTDAKTLTGIKKKNSRKINSLKRVTIIMNKHI